MAIKNFESLPTFTVWNKQVWSKFESENDENGTLIKFVAKLANLLESEMAAGKKMDDIFNPSYEKTMQAFGFGPDEDLFYCIAIDTLIDCWVYGPFLRIWKDATSERCKACRDRIEKELFTDAGADRMLVIIV